MRSEEFTLSPRSRIRNPKSYKGFTLIELLVVITIIMILAAILFPVFSRARSRAQQESCASNLRQCAIAMRMYRDEWDGKLPPQNLSVLTGFKVPGPQYLKGPQNAIWVGQIYPYLRNIPVMRCKDAVWGYIDQLNDIPYGYGLNARLTPYISPSGVFTLPVAKVFSESNTILMADCSALFFGENGDSVMNAAYADAPSGTYRVGEVGIQTHIRHDTQSNVIYMDCHAGADTPSGIQSEMSQVP